jgi:hypothetical protein
LDLYQKQAKDNQNLKYLKVDFFYVNFSTFNFSLSYIDKIPVKNIMQKLIIDVDFAVSVESAKTFAKFVLADLSSVSAQSSKDLLLGYVEEFLRNFFLHEKLDFVGISNSKMEELKTKFIKFLSKIGLNLKSFAITFNEKSKPKKNTTEKSNLFKTLDREEILDYNPTKQTEQSEVATEKILLDGGDKKEIDATQENQTPVAESKICPVCKSKSIFGSIYCHHCGYKF